MSPERGPEKIHIGRDGVNESWLPPFPLRRIERQHSSSDFCREVCFVSCFNFSPLNKYTGGANFDIRPAAVGRVRVQF